LSISAKGFTYILFDSIIECTRNIHSLVIITISEGLYNIILLEKA
jgi:hypothetical protein